MIDLAQAAVPKTTTRTRRRHQLDNHYEQILSQLQCLSENGGKLPHAIGVMGLERGDGATSVAANLATVAAESGIESVLLIDANGSRPSLHKVFRIAGKPGFHDALRGACATMECVHPTSVPGLSVMPYGANGKGSTAAIAPGSWNSPFSELQAAYDLVVVDLPAAGESGIGLALAKSLNGIVLVLESERSRKSAAIRAKQQLEHIGANILGVVLNKRRHHVPNWLYRSL